jgi:hypothetical protein
MGGLFMLILKDPGRARNWGLLGAKAQLTAGTADWPTYFSLLAQAMAVGGTLLFALVTAWVFGREFADGTVKELLALPTPRAAIIGAKFAVVTLWVACLTAVVLAMGLLVGMAIGLPGWSAALLRRAALDLAATAGLTLALMPPVALLASAGRGYLPPLGWAMLTLFLARSSPSPAGRRGSPGLCRLSTAAWQARGPRSSGHKATPWSCSPAWRGSSRRSRGGTAQITPPEPAHMGGANGSHARRDPATDPGTATGMGTGAFLPHRAGDT